MGVCSIHNYNFNKIKWNSGHMLKWLCMNDEACQEFRGQVVPQIEAVHNLREVCMYLNVLSLQSTSLRESRKGNLKKNKKIYSDFLVKN